MEKEEIELILHKIKKKIYLNVDQAHLMKQLTDLSSQIANLKKQKDYNEGLKKLLSIVSSNYAESLDSFTLNIEIPKIKKQIDNTSQEILKQIIHKSDKMEEIMLMADFLSYETFEDVMKIRSK